MTEETSTDNATKDQSPSTSSNQLLDDEDSNNSSHDVIDGLVDELDEIAGSKCRVPYSHEWGPISYQNAMVLHAEPIESEGELQVSNYHI